MMYDGHMSSTEAHLRLIGTQLIDTQTASVIAEFRKERTHTAVGVVHAVLAFNFNDDTLLVKALVALCVNRWLDWTGS